MAASSPATQLSSSAIFRPPFLNRLLQLCTKSKAFTVGKQVHAQTITHNYSRKPSMATKILQFYSDCDDFDTACYLFDQMPNPNIFSWTSILALFSRSSTHIHTLLLYSNMIFCGLSPDSYVFPILIRASAHASSSSAGLSLHQHAVVHGHGRHLHVCNSLIDMYSKFGYIEKSKKVFDRMDPRDILSWNSIISAYVGNGFPDEAIQLFEFMETEGVAHPDMVTSNIMIDAYCRNGLCSKGARVLRGMEHPDLISWTTLISGYSRVGEHDKSLESFRDMVRLMTKKKNMNKVVSLDHGSLSSILVSCRHLGCLRNGREVHGCGLKTVGGFYDSVGPALLVMYATCGEMESSRRVFRLMGKRDVAAWNAMVYGLVQEGSNPLAFECFKEMIGVHVEADHITLSTLLPACVSALGKEIHGYAQRRELVDILCVSNALVHMYAGNGCIKSAYHVFSGMVARDVVSWNTMIAGLGKHGLGDAAVRTFWGMCLSGFSPNGVTFTSVLAACSHSGMVDEGMELFSSLRKKYGLVPKMEHFACVVDMLTRAGRVEEAVEFVRDMPVKPDGSVWGALLVGSRAHGHVAVAKGVAERLFRAEPDHAGNYVTLSHLYAEVGRWEDALEVRRKMEHESLIKPSGISLVE